MSLIVPKEHQIDFFLRTTKPLMEDMGCGPSPEYSDSPRRRAGAVLFS